MSKYKGIIIGLFCVFVFRIIVETISEGFSLGMVISNLLFCIAFGIIYVIFFNLGYYQALREHANDYDNGFEFGYNLGRVHQRREDYYDFLFNHDIDSSQLHPDENIIEVDAEVE